MCKLLLIELMNINYLREYSMFAARFVWR